MPTLPIPRQEAFAIALAQGHSAAEALRAAGYRSDRRNGTRMTTKDDVVRRVEELQLEAAERAAVTVTSLLTELEEERLQALERGQIAAAVAATREKGILTGLRIERTSADVRTSHVDTMTDAELGAIIATALTDEELQRIIDR
jgi:phage terminase small subunit